MMIGGDEGVIDNVVITRLKIAILVMMTVPIDCVIMMMISLVMMVMMRGGC